MAKNIFIYSKELEAKNVALKADVERLTKEVQQLKEAKDATSGNINKETRQDQIAFLKKQLSKTLA